MRKIWAIGAVLGLAMVTQVYAQLGQQEEQRARDDRAVAGAHKFCLASQVKGMTVTDKGNQPCGQIQDLAIDQTGRVQYLAIDLRHDAANADATDVDAADRPRSRPTADERRAARGEANVEDANAKLTLVPFELCRFHDAKGARDAESQGFVSLNIEQARLAEAPTFTRQQLEMIGRQPQLISKVDNYFVRDTSGAARPDFNQRRQQQEQERERDEK